MTQLTPEEQAQADLVAASIQAQLAAIGMPTAPIAGETP